MNEHADDQASPLEASVVLPNEAGLHARSAASLIKETTRFRSSVTLCLAGGTASTRSLMELLRLGARQGDTLRIQATGSDAEAALHAVKHLIERGFGDDQVAGENTGSA
jgi:phosphotransferase system HPr (HPr) family protein